MYESNEKNTSGNNNAIKAILGILLIALLAAGAFLLLGSSEDSNQLSSKANTKEAPTNTTEEKPNIDIADVTDSEISDEDLQTDGVKFVVKGFQFKSAGTVSSPEVLAGVEAATTATYAEFGTSGVTVDASDGPKAWEASVPRAVQALTLLTNGSIEVTDEATILTGRAASELEYQQIKGLLSLPEAGFPPLQDNVELIPAVPGEVKIVSKAGQVDITGVAPSQILADRLTEQSKQLWPNATVNFAVDETRVMNFGWARYQTLVGGLTVFGDYEAGSKNGTPYAILQSGLNFDTNSATLNAASQQKLTGLAPIMLSSINPITISGHTDITGNAQANLALSKARAASVAKALEAGTGGLLTPERFLTDGFGSDQPIGSNDTEEGKAANRRVEISISNPNAG